MQRLFHSTGDPVILQQSVLVLLAAVPAEASLDVVALQRGKITRLPKTAACKFSAPEML